MTPPRPPFRPAGVVFDLDGVLVDSEGLWAEAERRVLTDLGVPWSPRIQEAMIGRGPADAAAVLASHVDGADPADVERRMLAAAREVMDGRVRPRPGAVELVAALRGRVPLAVATNSRRVLAEASLASAGLPAARFDAVVTVDDVAAPKPDPEPYAVACQAIAAPAERVVALEDSPVGARSARAAGCWVIGCPEGVGGELAAVHAQVAGLGEIDANALLAGAGVT